MAHTPGPWEIASYRNYFGFSVWSPHGPCIAERWFQHERTAEQNDEMRANANLIAATPELLEALKAVAAQAESWHKFHHGSSNVQCDSICELIPQMNAAIDKAEGRQ